MDVTANSKLPLGIQWIVALAVLLVSSFLVSLLVRTPHAPQLAAVHTMSLMVMALVVYAWWIYPTSGSLAMSVSAVLVLAWAWAVHRAPLLGMDVASCGLLITVAGWQRRRWARRFQRLQQTVEDLREEHTVKEQAITLANQTREALQKKLARYTQLQTIAEELSNLTALGTIAQLAVDRAFALIGKSDTCLLFLVDPERQELSLFASKKRESLATIRAKQGDQFDRHVLRTHRPLLVNDVRRDFRFTVTVSPEREVSAVIACPLLIEQSAEGVLRLDSAQAGVYTQDDLRFLDILLGLVSTALTNAKLFAQAQQLAVTDGLTGLSLRRPFLEHLARELTRAARSREAVSVLMVDVDHFKTYNDTFGHTAGDLILKGVAEVLRTIVPPGGAIARYGGEEFVILLPRTTRHQATHVAEQIRRTIEHEAPNSARHVAPTTSRRPSRQGGSPAPSDSPPVSRHPEEESVGPSGRREASGVTVSVGVASFPDDAQVELELIRIADQRLYQAKRAGRNVVVSA